MEVELKRLEDLADAVVNDFAYMRQREQEMRDTNGKEYCHFDITVEPLLTATCTCISLLWTILTFYNSRAVANFEMGGEVKTRSFPIGVSMLCCSVRVARVPTYNS